MPISQEYTRLKLSEITIDREARQRQEIQTTDLELSIARNGVLVPIIVTREGKLVAGERRLEASRRLGLSDIPVRFFDSLSPAETEIIELEENVKRQDLKWQEKVLAASRIHALYKELDSEWTQTQTAEMLCMNGGILSEYLKINKQMGDSRVAEAKTLNEARNILARREQRQTGEALEELLEFIEFADAETDEKLSTVDKADLDKELELANTMIEVGDEIIWAGTEGLKLLSPALAPKRMVPRFIPSEPLICEDFLSWVTTYSGQRFNLIHCDFPYGIGHFERPQARWTESQDYSDSPELFANLLNCFLTNLDKFCSQSAHVLFWYSEKQKARILEQTLKIAPSLSWHEHPLVWLKSDNVGIAPDSRRGPRHIYETCLFGTRGDRHITQIVGDAYASPTDKRLHPSCKPEPMLRHFFGMLVDEQTRLFDPTAGSGSALRAAESLGASKVLGLELNPLVAKQSADYMRSWRILRS